MEKYTSIDDFLKRHGVNDTGSGGQSTIFFQDSKKDIGSDIELVARAKELSDYARLQRKLIDGITKKAKELGKVRNEEVFRRNLARKDLDELEKLLKMISQLETQQDSMELEKLLEEISQLKAQQQQGKQQTDHEGMEPGE